MTGITFPLLTIGGAVAQEYGVDRQYLVIDGDGIVRWIGHTHSLPVAQIQDTIEAYLAILDYNDSPPPLTSGDFGIQAAYPNPFNAVATIPYAISEPGQVALSIHNVLGQKVVELANGPVAAGRHQATWNAADQASGIYFVRLEAGSQVAMQKIVLLK